MESTYRPTEGRERALEGAPTWLLEIEGEVFTENTDTRTDNPHLPEFEGMPAR